MNALVICFSKFGNTKKVAGAIAATLESKGSARVVSTDQLAAADLDGADLVVMGSPTHRMNLPEAVRPMFDAFYGMLGADRFMMMKENETIEIVPIAYMRGRTLDNAFVILDEAQNTTPEQMKMFLTRMGEGSRVVVTGDITQIDLERKKRSGLVLIKDILKDIPEIRFCFFAEEDVVRHAAQIGGIPVEVVPNDKGLWPRAADLRGLHRERAVFYYNIPNIDQCRGCNDKDRATVAVAAHPTDEQLP